MFVLMWVLAISFGLLGLATRSAMLLVIMAAFAWASALYQ